MPKRRQRDDDTPGGVTFTPIGVMRSVFREKYSVPRQPGMSPSARGILCLRDDPDLRAALQGIEDFSHLWVLYHFHATGSERWLPRVRAPRLGGAAKVGVLASRSPHRPNAIGMSVVARGAVELAHPDGPRVEVSGVDLLDGTPILDVKPYLAYADSVPRATAGWAGARVPRAPVRFARGLTPTLRALERTRPALRALIRELLSLDPRPAFQQRKMPLDAPASIGTRWGFAVMDLEVSWVIAARGIIVVSVTPR